MKNHRNIKTGLILALALSFSLAACKKEEEKGGGDEKAEMKKPDEKPADKPADKKPDEKPDEKPADTAPAGDGNSVTVIANHEPKKEGDPVMVKLTAVKVVKAEFDPKNLEGATAELEIDLSKIDSGDKKRDGHLQSPDFLDIGKFATASVKISGVKKDGDAYAGEAEVSAHGITQKFPVKFQVVETMEDGIKVKAEHKFNRSDFKLGEKKELPVAQELTIQLEMVLKKTA